MKVVFSLILLSLLLISCNNSNNEGFYLYGKYYEPDVFYYQFSPLESIKDGGNVKIKKGHLNKKGKRKIISMEEYNGFWKKEEDNIIIYKCANSSLNGTYSLSTDFNPLVNRFKTDGDDKELMLP